MKKILKIEKKRKYKKKGKEKILKKEKKKNVENIDKEKM